MSRPCRHGRRPPNTRIWRQPGSHSSLPSLNAFFGISLQGSGCKLACPSNRDGLGILNVRILMLQTMYATLHEDFIQGSKLAQQTRIRATAALSGKKAPLLVFPESALSRDITEGRVSRSKSLRQVIDSLANNSIGAERAHACGPACTRSEPSNGLCALFRVREPSSTTSWGKESTPLSPP